MLRQGSLINLVHSHHELEIVRRWANAIRMNGVDAEMLSESEVRKLVPILNRRSRYPVIGALIQRRAGISRHDAVVWGFARGASAHGVDLVQNCEVTGFEISGNRVRGVNTSQGLVSADKVVMNVAGYSSQLAKLAGFKLPITTMALQA